MSTARPVSRARRALTLAIAAALVGFGASVAIAAPAAAAGTTGCGYGSNGPGASTLCWIDMSAYDPAVANTPAGQPFSITLPGGYTAAFDIHTSAADKPVFASAFPTWSGAAIGQFIYVGTPGKPALYQNVATAQLSTTITMDHLVVKDSSGQAVHGWNIVGADAESTYGTESLTFSADTHVSEYASYSTTPGGNGCQANVTEAPDGKSLTCTGNFAPSTYGTIVVAATEPSTFSQKMVIPPNANAAEAVAFAFQSATITGTVSVAKRVLDSDTFGVTLTSPESTVVSTAGTNSAATATTGEQTVLPRVAGQAYTLSVTGTDLAAYTFTWSCTRNGTADPSLTRTGTTLTVQPVAGDVVVCTAAASVAGPALAETGTKDAPEATAAGAGLVVLGLLLVVVGRRRSRGRHA